MVENKARPIKRPLLFREFLTLFVVFPIVLYAFRVKIAFLVLPLILVMAAGCVQSG